MTMTENNFVDYYALLDVAPDASPKLIRQAFMRQAKQQHPDAGGSLESMQRLNFAYATLKNESTRRAYDMMHSFKTGKSELHYQAPFTPRSGKNTMEDDEVDDFIDSIFAEYASKKPQEKLYTRARSAFRFGKKKDSG